MVELDGFEPTALRLPAKSFLQNKPVFIAFYEAFSSWVSRKSPGFGRYLTDSNTRLLLM